MSWAVFSRIVVGRCRWDGQAEFCKHIKLQTANLQPGQSLAVMADMPVAVVDRPLA